VAAALPLHATIARSMQACAQGQRSLDENCGPDFVMAEILETPRLLLRPWRDSDVAAWAAMNADPRVMEYFPSTYDRERSETTAARLRERLDRDGYGWWIVEMKHGPSFAGVVALQDVPFDAHFTPALEVGWRLAYPYWGAGIATEGARAALGYAFLELGRSEVVALTAAVNLRSQRVMQRLGMTYDSRDDFEHPNVEPGHRLRPHVLYRVRASSSPVRDQSRPHDF
jgi:RimJ/RimL family protein N-acetyltransferase